MNILVVEDIEIQRKALVDIIKENFNRIEVYEAENTIIAMNILQEKKIDLFILDINLEGESGMDLAKKIREYNKYKLTGIVFITSEMTYLMHAIKYAHCYDYIVKPYDENKIKEIIEVFLNKEIEIEESNSYSFLNLSKEISVKIYHKDIIFIEYCLRCCKIHTQKNIYAIKGKSLEGIIKEINYKNLVQSHKSYAINIDRVEGFEKYYEKLWNINFYNYNEKAKLGYRYKKQILDLI